MTKKTDAQVLSDAIDILAEEGVWCKGSWADKNGDGKISMCMEGAVLKAMGWILVWKYDSYGNPIWSDSTNLQYDHLRYGTGSDQYRTIENALLKSIEDHTDEDYCSPNSYNDRESTSLEDVLLVMKHAQEELSK